MLLVYVSLHIHSKCAIDGTDFMQSAHNSYYLTRRHENYFNSISGLGSLIILLGKLFICSVTTFVSYIILNESSYYKESIT